jgi:hypothetical protein
MQHVFYSDFLSNIIFVLSYNLCQVMVDTVERTISVQHNASSATTALRSNNLEWERNTKIQNNYYRYKKDTVPTQFDNRD